MTDQPTPIPIFEALTAYQKSAALGAAIELDLFTAVGEGATDVAALGKRLGASERGVRSLCDYMVVHGFLEKADGRYSVPGATALFLDRRSPAYMGSVATFLNSDTLKASFADVTAAVRRGGTTLGEQGTMTPDHPVWVSFARAMAPMAAVSAERLAEILTGRGIPGDGERRVLDIAAGHGLYGIALLKRWKSLSAIAVDWPAVLAVARENAAKAGVSPRLETRGGSAFDADLGGPYDLALLPNFLHHFDHDRCVVMLRRVREHLVPGGRVAIVESLPNEDRVSPPMAAAFSLIMLATTEKGDAYTLREIDAMLRDAGFGPGEALPLEPTFQHAVIARIAS
ncbi:MAG: methyltransferase [Acidobacteriota bacterium]